MAANLRKLRKSMQRWLRMNHGYDWGMHKLVKRMGIESRKMRADFMEILEFAYAREKALHGSPDLNIVVKSD